MRCEYGWIIIEVALLAYLAGMWTTRLIYVLVRRQSIRARATGGGQ